MQQGNLFLYDLSFLNKPEGDLACRIPWMFCSCSVLVCAPMSFRAEDASQAGNSVGFDSSFVILALVYKRELNAFCACVRRNVLTSWQRCYTKSPGAFSAPKQFFPLLYTYFHESCNPRKDTNSQAGKFLAARTTRCRLPGQVSLSNKSQAVSRRWRTRADAAMPKRSAAVKIRRAMTLSAATQR